MIIGLVQQKTPNGNIYDGIQAHHMAIQFALNHHVEGIFFPELSLTGYEPALAKTLAKNPRDPIFNTFQETSDEYNIIIGVGVPVLSSDLQIGMMIFQPGQPPLPYTKQYLHPDELTYFSPGNTQAYIHWKDALLAPAICYESLLQEHIEPTIKKGATTYLASVAKSAKGMEKAHIHYRTMAKKHKITVMVMNSIGPCDNFTAKGRSSVWNNQGQQMCELSDTTEGMIVYDTNKETAASYYF